MGDWAKVQLDDVADLSGGYAFKSSQYTDAGRFVLRTVNINDQFSIIMENANFISEAEAKEFERFSLQEHDTLFVMVAATLGKIGYVRERDLPALLNQNMWVIRAKEGAIDPVFLHYLFRQISKIPLSWVGGSARSFLRRDDVRKLEFELPGPAEQEKIAHALKTLDDKIELNRRMNETLEEMARALFRDWFVDFGPTRRQIEGATDPAAIMGHAFSSEKAAILSPLFPAKLGDDGLPEGWSHGTAADHIDFNPKEPLKKGTVAPYSDMASLPTSGSLVAPPVDRDFKSGMRFRNGDALIARITPCLENGKAGFVDYLTEEAPVGWGSTEFFVLRSKPHVAPQFAYCLVRDPDFRKRAEQSMTGTSGRQRAQIEVLMSHELAVPSENVHGEFRAITTSFFEKIKANGEENQTLADMRDLLLPKLMSGEIPLKDAEVVAQAETDQSNEIFSSDMFGEQVLTPEQKAEREIVMVAANVQALQKDDLLVGNVRLMKANYLIHRRMGWSTDEFERRAAGPHCRRLNEDVRQTARQRSWIREATATNTQGESFLGNRPASNYSEVEPLIAQYGLSEAMGWLYTHFNGASREWMECVATVDDAMQMLKQAGTVITVENVKANIAATPEWAAKLSKAYFSDSEITKAIDKIEEIFPR